MQTTDYYCNVTGKRVDCFYHLIHPFATGTSSELLGVEDRNNHIHLGKDTGSLVLAIIGIEPNRGSPLLPFFTELNKKEIKYNITRVSSEFLPVEKENTLVEITVNLTVSSKEFVDEIRGIMDSDELKKVYQLHILPKIDRYELILSTQISF